MSLTPLYDAKGQWLVRASEGRSSTSQEITEVAQWPVRQVYTRHLHRHPDRKPREAQVELRYGTLTFTAPKRATTAHPTLTFRWSR